MNDANYETVPGELSEFDELLGLPEVARLRAKIADAIDAIVADAQRRFHKSYRQHAPDAAGLATAVSLGKQMAHLARNHRRMRELPPLPSENAVWKVLGDRMQDPLPSPWVCLKTHEDGGMWRGVGEGDDRHRSLLVGCTVQPVGSPPSLWQHVSASHTDRVPSYATLCRVKDLFFGPDASAVCLWPKTSEHVNAHPYTLHLWSPAQGDPLPDLLNGGLLL